MNQKKIFQVTQGMRITQLIIYTLPMIELSQIDTLTNTIRDKKGFGSTGTHGILQDVYNHANSTSPTTAAAAQLNDNSENNTHSKYDVHETYNVLCSSNPFEDCEEITIPIRGKHETQGLILKPCDVYNNKI